MRLHPETRTRILADVTLDVDPTDATVEVKVDAAWFPAVWLADAAAAGSRWTRTARTTDYFCGPDATPGDATVLDLGRHRTRTRVSVDGDELVNESSPIDVRA